MQTLDQFEGTPNLDYMADDDLDQFLKDIDSVIHFLATLQNYGATLTVARTLRKCGQIEEALKLESKMQSIYDSIPDHLKW